MFFKKMKIEIRSLRAPGSSKMSRFSQKREKNVTFCEIRLVIFRKLVILGSSEWSKSDQRGAQNTAFDVTFVVGGVVHVAI